MKTPLIILAATLLAVPALRAQIVADGTTNTLSNVTTNFIGDVTIGTNGSFTLLVLSDNTLVTNSVNGLIGRNGTAKSNEVQLLSATALWRMGGSLFVGSNGSLSRLVVSNGAFVNNNNGILGNGASSSNNLALVTGSGSFWSNRIDLTVGVSGRDNQLIVSNGARVVNRVGNLGSQPGSSNNLVVVTGNGSSWTNHSDVNVGIGDRGNRLVIEAGGQVGGDNGRVGAGAFGGNSEALVTGPGSLWSSRTDLAVGLNPANNRLVVSNGAVVVAGNNGRVGVSIPATGNEVLITGVGSLWSNRFELYVGEGGPGNRMEVNSGGLVVSSTTHVGNQSASNFALVTGAGSLWSNRGDLYVGNSSSVNQLVVSNGAAVYVGTNGIVGKNTGANANSILVTGPGTSFWVGTNFYVGSNGSLNRLVISNSALVMHERFGGMGVNLTSVSNETVVTGPGSAWRYGVILNVGGSGAGNRLTITNGGLVTGNYGVVGGSEGSNNVTIVTGPGSVWSNRLDFVLGSFGSGNRLIVSAGGRVDGDNGYIGQNSTSIDNEALVTGPNSSWISLNLLEAGRQGSRSRLTVTNGGLVSANQIVLGEFALSTNNRVVVDGGTQRANSELDVRRGTNVLNAGLVEADRLLLTNAQGRFEFNGGTLITRGAFITNIVPFVVGVAGTNPAVWDVRSGSSYVITVPLILGQFSPFNQLLVTNGALLTSGGGFVGLNSNARSNTVVVAGPGSTWSNSLTLEIGSAAPFNSLVVSNGGFVRNTIGTLGQSGGGNNLALVTGSGSVWSNANNLVVGSLGSSNQLLVLDGGTVKVPFAGVGTFASSNNLVVVAGSNSLWHTLIGLSFGSDSAGNLLVVSNGGLVSAESAELGQFSTGSNNLALVTGPGSVWTNGNLTVGGAGRGNQLIVNNGGVARNSTTTLGSNPSGGNNVVLVTDSGSALNNTFALHVGYDGPRNVLVVSNGAVALDNFGVVGFDATSSNNFALVTGSGSVWSNALEHHVGLFGSGNQLVVSNGSLVAAGVGFIGHSPNANLNSVIVTDPGTRWLLSTNLYVGSNGALNRLVITNGAFVADGSGFIGTGNSSSNNLAVVTGPGSVWSNAGDFFVGLSGAGNQLVVSNGALLVSSSNAWLGFAATSRSNAALVTGAGTTWSNGQTLLVGESGNGNRLTVSEGARIESKFGWIGLLTSATNNEVVVTGPGSFWETEQDLNIGGLGSGNRLVITNGGSVRNNSGAGIGTALSVSNQVVVTDAGSSWTLGSLLFVGQVASGCRLVISNSGAVFQEAFGLIVGKDSSSTNNRIQVDGGTLLVTNAVSGKFDVRRGSTVLNAGLIEVTQLLLTNNQGFLQINGGTFSTRNSRVSNGTLFDIGNGTSPATFILAGNGLHEFSGILAARVSSNATFTGNGTIGGAVPLQFRVGSRLVPGTSVGQMVFSNSPALQGTVVMEITKIGGTLTNDQIQVIAPLTYGGSLTVSNLGPSALTAGDRFPLFSASSYAGGFTNISLPPLSPGLGWTNKLLMDGSIEVVVGPQFTSISLSSTNVIFSGTGGISNVPYAVLTATNVLEALSNWLSLVTNQFGPGGEFSFTNGIAPDELQRYFRIRTP